MRRGLFLCAVIAALLTSGPSHSQQAAGGYPQRQVRIVVPYPPGGPTDLIGRILAQKLSARLGQSFFVENVNGASGAVGAGQVGHAAPDGYNLLIVTNDFAVASVTNRNLPYDPVKDFSPVTMISSSPSVVVGQSFRAGENHEGAGGARQSGAAKIQLRRHGHRLWPAQFRAAVQARPEARRSAAGPLQRGRARDQRHARRRHPNPDYGTAAGRALSELRQIAGAGGYQREAQPGFSGHSDARRSRNSRVWIRSS